LNFQDWIEYLEKQGYTEFHFGIFSEPYLTMILEINPRKTEESRWSIHDITPHDKIHEKAIVFIKRSSGNVEGYFTAGKIWFYTFPIDMKEIRKNHVEKLQVEESFLESVKDKKYVTIIEIKNPTSIEPFKVYKKDMRGWVTFTKEKVYTKFGSVI
jgi:hypothetical protein